MGEHDDATTNLSLGDALTDPPTLRSEGDLASLATVGIARFQLGPVLGKGGMGEVRSATDFHIGREVAVKRLLHRGPGAADAELRFLREARVQGRLDHPAIVPVYDIGLDDDHVPYFAMKRMHGTTLAEVLAGRAAGNAEALTRWPRRTLLARLVDICQAIEFAHSHGVVHRDLKPSNIMLGQYGEAYILDWGIARIDDDEALAPPISLDVSAAADGAGTATATGALLGTPGYMSPEQMRGEKIGPATDIYSLGCILFEILVGHAALPAGPSSFVATLEAKPHRPQQRYPLVDVAPELDDICARATEPAIADRYANVSELAKAIDGYLTGDRDVSRRRELADGHASIARKAVAAGDEAGRAEAVRQAGRAIALDPENRTAQTLLAHLLLEPPTVTPAGVSDAVEEARNEVSRIQLRAGARAYLGYLTILPALLWLGIRVVWPVAVVIALILAGAVVTALASRRKGPLGKVFYVVLAIQTALLAMIGILVSPLLLLPSLTVGSIAVFASHPTSFKPVVILVGHTLAFITPFILEGLGVVPRTFWMEGGRLIIHPWAVDLAMFPLLVFVLATVPVQLVVNLFLTLHLRITQERSEERLHLQSWHLRQLVPDAVEPSSPSSPRDSLDLIRAATGEIAGRETR